MRHHPQVQHQVSISGRVINAQTQNAIADAQVRIIDAPAAFTAANRPDQTQTATDGLFYFIDLPNGNYTLIASLPGAGRRYGAVSLEVAVSHSPDDKNVITVADLALPPTCLKGQVVNQDAVPIILAKVRLKYSEESSFSNQAGQYLLSGLEASEQFERTVIVSAQGYQPTAETVLLSQPGIEETSNFILRKNSKNL
ncbi:MAG: carboxypeptidase regulatory-like domain-containing protein [Pseudanabaenales cyanobacterium]|nr:carboxypeptidase regulatory-like domain-containing protein [Pseudanabaenales cyanobacterium]